MHDHQDRPAIYTPELVERILLAYGLAAGADVEVLAMPQGFGMALARVRSGGRDLVVKQLGPEQSDERTGFALRYHAHLHAAGVPSPRLYRSTTGELRAQVDAHRFCLLDWCQGERFDPDQADAETRRRRRRQMGALLGLVHAAGTPELAEAAPGSCRRVPGRLFTGLRPAAVGLPWSRGGGLARLAWLHWHERGEFGRELRGILPVLEATRRELVASPLATDPRLADVLPVHGDFHFENVLFMEGRVAGLLDFDNANIAPRAFDVGSAMAVVCQLREHEDDFLAGYEEGSGRPRPDADLLRACVLVRLVHSLTFQVVAYARRQVRSPEKARWWIRRLIRLLRAELAAREVVGR